MKYGKNSGGGGQKKSIPPKGLSPKISPSHTGGFKGGHGPKHKAAPYGCDKTHKKKSQ